MSDLDYNISRLLSGKTICNLAGEAVYIAYPSPQDFVYINRIINLVRGEAIRGENLSSDQIFDYLINQEIWDLKREEELERLPALIENLKVDLYQAYTTFKKRDVIKKKIQTTKERLAKLTEERHILDDYTTDGITNFIKSSYIIGTGVHRMNGERIWDYNSFLLCDFSILSSLTRQYSRQLLGDEEIRTISKNSRWRSLWSISKNPKDIFEIPSLGYLSDEQRVLVVWSQTYDSIYNHQECPPDEVIEDDDMLDGWLILQNRKRKQANKVETTVELNKPGHQDVFIMVENPDDVGRVNAMNDAKGKLLKKNILKKAGV
jgi:hypothetical protein